LGTQWEFYRVLIVAGTTDATTLVVDEIELRLSATRTNLYVAKWYSQDATGGVAY
jgi:hypothetical protein